MDAQTLNLILQVVIIALGLLAAYLAKKGLIDRKDFDETKNIASNLAASIDRLKDEDPDAAAKLIAEILERVGEKKPILDEFLKRMNLNPPTSTNG